MRYHIVTAVLTACLGLTSCGPGPGWPGALALIEAPAGGTTATLADGDVGAAQGVPPLPERRGGGPDQAKAKPKADGGFSLAAALPDLGALAAAQPAAETALSQDSPVAVYTRIARQIRACWLSPARPKLDNHGFHAEAAPGQEGEAKILIYEKVEGRKLGWQAFKIDIERNGGGALVRSDNVRLAPELGEALKADVARWTEGAEDCPS